jgi:hypothetical protein
MKFNMGCGHSRLDGYVNVDASPQAAADEVWDLEVMPWPWADDCADEIRFIHSLEHMGAEVKVFLGIMQETWRIARNGCRVVIHVPHPRSDNFLGDPTHVRAITPAALRLFDRALNETWRAEGRTNTPLGLYLGVDFRMIEDRTVVADAIWAQVQSGQISQAEIQRMVDREFNVATEYRIVLQARKPDQPRA